MSTCTTCNSPHHRATECAATSDRSMLYVPQAEVDALRAENEQLRQDVADLRELRNLDADNCPHCGEREALRARVAELEAELEQLRKWKATFDAAIREDSAAKVTP